MGVEQSKYGYHITGVPYEDPNPRSKHSPKVANLQIDDDIPECFEVEQVTNPSPKTVVHPGHSSKKSPAPKGSQNAKRARNEEVILEATTVSEERVVNLPTAKPRKPKQPKVVERVVAAEKEPQAYSKILAELTAIKQQKATAKDRSNQVTTNRECEQLVKSTLIKRAQQNTRGLDKEDQELELREASKQISP